MATKTQMVDFFYSKFIFIEGIKVTKRGLMKKTKEELTKMIQENGLEHEFESYTSPIKFFVEGIQCEKEYTWECTADSEDSVRKSLEQDGIKIIRIVSAKGHHRCKYCSCIATGSNINLLCDDCQELFGHTFYSEL